MILFQLNVSKILAIHVLLPVSFPISKIMNFDWNSIWSDVETFTFNRSIGKTTLSYISVFTRVGISLTKNKICNFSQITNSAASINSMLRCFYEFFAITDKETPFLQKES